MYLNRPLERQSRPLFDLDAEPCVEVRALAEFRAAILCVVSESGLPAA